MQGIDLSDGAGDFPVVDMDFHPLATETNLNSSDAVATGQPAAPVSSAADYLRECHHRFYHEHHWEVPFPRLPAARMLFIPPAVHDVFDVDVGVMTSELDAMSVGVLDSIPVVHAPIRCGEIRETVESVRKSKKRFEQLQQEWTERGNISKLIWTPMEQNQDLDPKDFDLIDTDIDAGLLEKRSMPSLSLLKRPLYTEIGLNPPEVLHKQRLSRLIPPQLVERISSIAPEASSSSFDRLSQVSLSSRGSGDLAGVGASQPHDMATQWKLGVVNSFKHALLIDKQFADILPTIADKKLGLGGHPNDELKLKLTADYWALLFDGTSGYEQQALWSSVCKVLHSAFVESKLSDVVPAIRESIGPLKDLVLTTVKPIDYSDTLTRRWVEWIAAFETELVRAVEFDVSKCSRQLDINESDCYFNPRTSEGPDTSAFKPDLNFSDALKRNSNKIVDPADKRTRLPIYPVECVPVFPSGYHAVVNALKAGNSFHEVQHIPLAARAEGLTQLVVQGVRDALPTETSCFEPHMLVGKRNLLVATDTVPRSSPAFAESPVTAVTYRASKNLVMEEYLHDASNTLSMLLQRSPEQGVFLYDFIPERREYRRDAAGSAPPIPKYVVLFDREEPKQLPVKRGAVDAEVNHSAHDNADDESVAVKKPRTEGRSMAA